MAAVSIRDLDDGVRERLRVRAAEHGRSMEAEIRAILTAAVDDGPAQPAFVDVLRRRFAELGDPGLDVARRSTTPRAAELPE